ncbi:hypothetical protein CDAR_438381 [Caerostris darwini]|uniref:Uncharacterized protein n=1 Tax=Caerostris darwini TaxID=1538125 RepID=A0AAV4X255_9ARAC|nr:hypothetical protein CDAR_438381 [Caerostris darwini]
MFKQQNNNKVHNDIGILSGSNNFFLQTFILFQKTEFLRHALNWKRKYLSLEIKKKKETCDWRWNDETIYRRIRHRKALVALVAIRLLGDDFTDYDKQVLVRGLPPPTWNYLQSVVYIYETRCPSIYDEKKEDTSIT